MTNRLLVFLLILPLTFSIINAHATTNTYQLKDPVTGKFYTIAYTITGGKLLDMKIDKEFLSIIIEVQADNNGTIKIEFPRTLIDERANIGQLIVLINGDEYDYEEMSATCDHRTLQVKFPTGTQEIEIISPYAPDMGPPFTPKPPPIESGIIPIHFGDENFTLNTLSLSKICGWNFDQSSKKLEFTVSGGEHFQVGFPSRLLDGDFTVFIDGHKTNFQQGKNDGNNTISISYHKSDVPRKIEIVGTSVIPEFPVVIMVISVAIGIMLYVTRFGKARGLRFIR